MDKSVDSLCSHSPQEGVERFKRLLFLLCVFVCNSQMNPCGSCYADSSFRTFADSGLFTECFFFLFLLCACLFLRDSIVSVLFSLVVSCL